MDIQMDTLRYCFLEKPRKIRHYPHCDSLLTHYFIKLGVKLLKCPKIKLREARLPLINPK